MKVFIALAFAALFCSVAPSQASAQSATPPGSWSDSCRNAYANGSTFTAECRRDDDSWMRSSIDLNQCSGGAIVNQNGSLVCESGNGQYNNDPYNNGGYNNGRYGNAMPGGSWRNSCRNARVGNGVLYADCQTGHGYNRTQITLSQCRSRALLNRGGNLQCANPNQNRGYDQYRGPASYSSAQLPGGSWSSSCRNAEMQGQTLVASCQNNNGVYRNASINVTQCAQNLVANRNGQLVCEEGQ